MGDKGQRFQSVVVRSRDGTGLPKGLVRLLLTYPSMIEPLRFRTGPHCATMAGLASLMTLLGTSHALADAPPQVSISIEATVPAGGVLSGTAYCMPSCDVPTPQFLDSEGAGVSGAFADEATSPQLLRNFVFVPDPPLVPGAYSASVTGLLNTATQPFTVVDVPFELPTFTSSVATESISEGDLIQCEVVGEDSLSAWFTQETRVRPRVTVTLTGPWAHQFYYALVLPGETPSQRGSTMVSQSFDVVGDELCFDVLGLSYVDDSVTEIGQECVSLEGLGVGVCDERSGDFRSTLLGCVVPPTGYQDDWCAVFEPAFSSQNCDAFDLDACFAARRDCPQGDDPSAEQEQEERDARVIATGTGGASGTGGGSGDRSTGGGGTGGISGDESTVWAGGTAGNPTASESSSDAGGCSVARVRPGPALPWLMGALALVFGVRARRGHRAR